MLVKAIMLIGNISFYLLYVRFGVNSDPQFTYSGPMLLQLKIFFPLIIAYLPNDNYKPA